MALPVMPRDVITYSLILDETFMNGSQEKIGKWVHRFMARNGFSLRRGTHVSQRNDDEVREMAQDFVAGINIRRQHLRLPMSLIVNMDQVSLLYVVSIKIVQDKHPL
jgi:hypothetical protein